jgi:amphi-Trp domain-containing protein
MSESELLDIEQEQSLEDSAAAMRALAGLLASADETVTVAYSGEIATVPAPESDVELELEVERGSDDETEVQVELELSWAVLGDEAENVGDAEEKAEDVEVETVTDEGDVETGDEGDVETEDEGDVETGDEETADAEVEQGEGTESREA